MQQNQQLQDLVYQCINHYVTLRQATAAGLDLIKEIDIQKRAMPLSEDEREALVNELTQRAWVRVASEHPGMLEELQ